MDNCTIHTGAEVEKAIKNCGAKLIYLSPYSPDFSPSEKLRSPLKNILGSIKTPNNQELAKAIEFAFNEVTERKYLEWAPVTAFIVPHLFDGGYNTNYNSSIL
jgi:transposase